MGGGRRHRSEDESGRSKKRRNDPPQRPLCPDSFRCHQCEGRHWTVECPRVKREPHRYPKIDILHGCFQCGQRGHNSAKCNTSRERCAACGGMHSTEHCVFSYIPVEYHEFYDTHRQRVYYCHSETGAVQWDAPDEHDIVLWHCDQCCLLIPNEVKECVKCHRDRPQNVIPSAQDSSTDGEEEEDSDEESTSSEKVDSRVVDGNDRNGAAEAPIQVVADTSNPSVIEQRESVHEAAVVQGDLA